MLCQGFISNCQAKKATHKKKKKLQKVKRNFFKKETPAEKQRGREKERKGIDAELGV